jgi:hypothetical protein
MIVTIRSTERGDSNRPRRIRRGRKKLIVRFLDGDITGRVNAGQVESLICKTPQ